MLKPEAKLQESTESAFPDENRAAKFAGSE